MLIGCKGNRLGLHLIFRGAKKALSGKKNQISSFVFHTKSLKTCTFQVVSTCTYILYIYTFLHEIIRLVVRANMSDQYEKGFRGSNDIYRCHFRL